MDQQKRFQKIPDRIRSLLRPPERITVPEWVEQNVRLPIYTSAEPGPLRISRTPYTRGPLLALGDPFIERVVLTWGRQLGKSQGVQYPYLCYCIAQDPGPAICLHPTIDKAKYTSRNRIQPMFDSCIPVCEQKTLNVDDYSILEMQFRNMTVSMVWGGSATQMTTRPARYLFRDEIDELKKAVGDNAIDPLSAIEQTTSNFSNRKIIDSSTPTTPEGNVWMAMKHCQFIFEFWVACPKCGLKQILYWDNIRYGVDLDPQVVENMAYYECDSCKYSISNLDKINMLSEGEWRARKEKDPVNKISRGEKALVEKTISLEEVLNLRLAKDIAFHLPKWYSPFSGGSFGIIAKEYLEAKRSFEEGNDFVLMRNWRNYDAAIPWEEIAVTESEIELMANKIDLPPLICPERTIALTAGIDPGQGGFWYSVYAWKKDYSSHLVQYGFMAGDYEDSGIADIIRDWTFPVKGEDRSLHIWRMGIDTGGSQYATSDTTMTEAAYLWVRRMRTSRLFGTKGFTKESFHRIRERRIDKMPGDKGLLIPGGLTLIEINSDAMKDVMWFHLRIEKDKPGRMTFHSETEMDYFRHLLAEEKRLQKNGTWEWVLLRKTNHYLDTTIIAFAMADSEFRGGIRLLRMPSVKEDKELLPEQKKSHVMPWRPKRNWVKDWQ